MARPESKRRFVAMVFLIMATVCLPVWSSGCKPKSDEEQIIEVLNKYFKAQALGKYRESYKYLAPEMQNVVSEDKWVESQSRSINSVRLMREPRLTDIVIQGNKATGVLHYMGIPTKTLTAAISQIYSRNFTLPMEDIVKEAERDLNENFDSMKEPLTMQVTFIRAPDGWRIFLDLGGDTYE